MLILKVVPFLLLPLRVCGAHFDLSKLLEKVIRESDSVAVYFTGIGDSFLTNFMRTHPDIVVGIFETIPTDYNEDFFQRNAILVTSAIDEGGQSRDELQTFIEHMRSRDFVITVASGHHSLYHSLSFCNEKNFKRIFGTLNDTSYAYLPFADQPLLQLTHIDEPLPDGLRDLNGFAFRTIVQMDIPSCFWYPDSRGRYQVGGYVGQTFIQFLRRHKATFQEVIINTSSENSVPAIISATWNNEIDICMNPYLKFEGVLYSRPVNVLSWCIVVAMNQHVDSYQPFFKPFSPTVWSIIGLALVFIVVMDFVKDISICVAPSWWRSFRRTYLVLLSAPAGDATTSAYRFHGQVLLFAFIVCNLYTIYCTSFLTAFIKTKPYDSIQDLIENNVPVVIPAVELSIFQRHGNHELDSIAFPVDYWIYRRALHSIRSPGLAYIVEEDFAQFLIQMRNPRRTVQIHLIRERVFIDFQMFLLPKHSPFKSILDTLIEDVIASGLLGKWESNARAQAIRAGFSVDKSDDLLPELPVKLKLEHLHFAGICLVVGLTVAMFVFLFELCTVRVLRMQGNRVTRA